MLITSFLNGLLFTGRQSGDQETWTVFHIGSLYVDINRVVCSDSRLSLRTEFSRILCDYIQRPSLFAHAHFGIWSDGENDW